MATTKPNASQITYQAAGTGAQVRTVDSKLGEVVSVFDFMTPAEIEAVKTNTWTTEVPDVTDAINASLAAASVVYMPRGTYVISSAINIPSQTRIYGDGIDRTTIKATTSGSGIINASSRHDNIRLEDFTFDGDNIAIVGVKLGVAGSVGTLAASSADLILRVKIANCTNTGAIFNYCQYLQFLGCVFTSTSGGYGLYLNECGHATLEDTLFSSNQTALFIGGDQYATNADGYSASSSIFVKTCWFYGPYSGSAQGYVVLSNAFNIDFTGCTFEHEISHSTPLVRLQRNGVVNITGNIYFNDCRWLGVAYNTTLIEITYGRRIYFKNCTAIPQNGGYYIISNTDGNAQIIIENCTANTAGYSTFATVFWGDSASYINAVSGTVTSITFSNAYQTGTWYATLTDGTQNATMAANLCNYVKIGKQVTVSGNISVSSLGAVTGPIRIAGLPFVISGFAGGSVNYAAGFSLTPGQSVTLLANNSESIIRPMVWNAAGGTTQMTAAQWGATGNSSITMTYLTAA